MPLLSVLRSLCVDCKLTDDICKDWKSWVKYPKPIDGKKRCMDCASIYGRNDSIMYTWLNKN